MIIGHHYTQIGISICKAGLVEWAELKAPSEFASNNMDSIVLRCITKQVTL